MSSLKQQIRSYLNLRQSILHRIVHGDLTTHEILSITQLARNSYQLRRRNSDLWTLDEIGALALALGYEAAMLKTIRQLTTLLSLLPPSQQQLVYRQAQLNSGKLRIRQVDYNYLKTSELSQIVEALE